VQLTEVIGDRDLDRDLQKSSRNNWIQNPLCCFNTPWSKSLNASSSRDAKVKTQGGKKLIEL